MFAINQQSISRYKCVIDFINHQYISFDYAALRIMKTLVNSKLFHGAGIINANDFFCNMLWTFVFIKGNA